MLINKDSNHAAPQLSMPSTTTKICRRRSAEDAPLCEAAQP
ncbi:hypothetical protein [Marinobacterium stanieri]|nr:hypothetical protein [Marinobacterium stanieri]